jgi:hypothetical protein
VTTDQFDNLVAQIAHASAAYAITITFYVFGISIFYPIPIVIAFAAVKEFWWDIRYETEGESGGVVGGVEDFTFYVVGLAIAAAVVAIRHYTL